jgi:AraC-like DNA-binding protein
MHRRATHRQRQRLERAVAHYLKDCYRRCTVARVSELAQLLGLDVAYLSRVAAAALGMPLGDYLRRRQLEEAERLLLTTPLPARFIARRSGFGTISTFYRCFQAAYGMPPGAFREVNK